MMQWQIEQSKKLMGDLKSVPVVVHQVYPDVTNNVTIKRWKLVCTHDGALVWLYTYNPDLAQVGTYDVQLYQDNSAQMRRCIRKPKEY